MEELRQDMLKQYLILDTVSDKFFWRIDHFTKQAGQEAGYKQDNQVIIGLLGNRYTLPRLRHLYLHGSWPTETLRNPNPRPRKVRGAIPYRGVSKARSGKYCSQYCRGGKRVWLGTFDTRLEASIAYNEYAESSEQR